MRSPYLLDTAKTSKFQQNVYSRNSTEHQVSSAAAVKFPTFHEGTPPRGKARKQPTSTLHSYQQSSSPGQYSQLSHLPSQRSYFNQQTRGPNGSKISNIPMKQHILDKDSYNRVSINIEQMKQKINVTQNRRNFAGRHLSDARNSNGSNSNTSFGTGWDRSMKQQWKQPPQHGNLQQQQSSGVAEYEDGGSMRADVRTMRKENSAVQNKLVLNSRGQVS